MKFFYYFGVYMFCAYVHDVINDMPDILRGMTTTVKDLCNIIEDENKTIEHKNRRETVNRIGF